MRVPGQDTSPSSAKSKVSWFDVLCGGFALLIFKHSRSTMGKSAIACEIGVRTITQEKHNAQLALGSDFALGEL